MFDIILISTLSQDFKKRIGNRVDVLVLNNLNTEAVAGRCSVIKVFLEISQNSHENTCARVSFLIKLQAETLAQLFCCKFCKIFKKIFLYKTPPVAASVNNWIVL